MSKGSKKTSRREFLQGAAGAVTAFTIVPRHVLGQGMTPPSEKLNVAGIGAGGMGGGDIDAVAGAGGNIVALCDVDMRPQHRDRMVISKYPEARVYRDFRKMFDEMEDKIDAVIVGTPDHTHAVAAMAAMKFTVRSPWLTRSARSAPS